MRVLGAVKSAALCWGEDDDDDDDEDDGARAVHTRTSLEEKK